MKPNAHGLAPKRHTHSRVLPQNKQGPVGIFSLWILSLLEAREALPREALSSEAEGPNEQGPVGNACVGHFILAGDSGRTSPGKSLTQEGLLPFLSSQDSHRRLEQPWWKGSLDQLQPLPTEPASLGTLLPPHASFTQAFC